MTASSTILTLAALAIFAGIAALSARRARPRSPSSIADRRRRASGTDPGDRLHRHVAHYRASGAVPRWDP